MNQFAIEIEESRRKQTAFWNAVADGWINEFEFVESWFEPVSLLMKSFFSRGAGTLLDIGCGASSQDFGNQWSVIGIDVADKILRPGSIRGSANCLPFMDKSFEGISSRFCLMFCPNLPGMFAEIRRCGKPGLAMAFSVWGKPEENLWSSIPNERFAELAGIRKPEPNEPGAFRLSDRTEVTQLLTESGFCDISVESVKLPKFQELGGRLGLETLLRFAGPMRLAYLKIPERDRETVFEEVAQAMENENLTGSADVWFCKTQY